MKSSERFLPVLLLILPFFMFYYADNLTGQTNDSGNSPDFIILMPADSSVDSFPVLKVKPFDDPVSNIVYHLAEDSWMKSSNELYRRVQNFLVNTRKQHQIESAYLLLSQHQGGFPQQGFYLLQGDSLIDKRHVGYVELVKNNENPEDYLGSMTQIYPHEMGHVLYHLLSENSDSTVPASIDVHYSTLITDYQTAFNEGFAMHFENMSREYEPDSQRKENIIRDFDYKMEKCNTRLAPFRRDFTWPLRSGLYRATMVLWYQDFEDIKRYAWVNENRVRFRNASLKKADAEKMLYFRNSGTEITDVQRNLQQILSTEGMTASFFMKMMRSDLKFMKADTAVYRDFADPEGENVADMMAEIGPLENEYLKIFYVLHKHVNQTLTQRSQMLDFIDGYCQEYPDEKPIIKGIFKEWSGLSYPVDPGIQRWILNPDHSHGILVMDQFGGIKLPFYTFNLNAATEADLLTFPEIDRASAASIISFIDSNGPIKNLDDLDKIPGISEAAINILKENNFDPEFLKNFDENELNLTINGLLSAALLHILLWFAIWFALLLILAYMEYRLVFKQRFSTKNRVYLFLRYLGFFIAALTTLVLTTNPFAWFVVFGLVYLIIQYFVYRKKENVFAGLVGTILILVVIGYSLV